MPWESFGQSTLLCDGIDDDFGSGIWRGNGNFALARKMEE
jgi:hypothetical protein